MKSFFYNKSLIQIIATLHLSAGRIFPSAIFITSFYWSIFQHNLSDVMTLWNLRQERPLCFVFDNWVADSTRCAGSIFFHPMQGYQHSVLLLTAKLQNKRAFQFRVCLHSAVLNQCLSMLLRRPNLVNVFNNFDAIWCLVCWILYTCGMMRKQIKQWEVWR